MEIEIISIEHYIRFYSDTGRLTIFDLRVNGIPQLSKQIEPIEFFYLENDIIYSHIVSIPNNAGILEYSKIANFSGEYYEGTFQLINITKEDFNTGELLGSNLTMNGTFKIKKK